MTRAETYEPGHLTRAELRDLGRSLRKRCPRSSHGEWQGDPDRPDPMKILRSQEAIRVQELLPIRYGRMVESPFKCYRGSAAVMAWDLARTPTIGVNVQACGDAHMNNFGGYASPERQLIFDINDFDETIPAPWEYDIKRLAASLVLDARDQGYPTDAEVVPVRAMTERYLETLSELSELTSLEVHYQHISERTVLKRWKDKSVREDVKRYAAKARRRNNLQAFRRWVVGDWGSIRFREDPPLLTRLPDEHAERLHQRFNRYRDTLPPNRCRALSEYRFRDAAHKVVGVGSVGLRSYVLLLEGRGERDPLFIQIKEATRSVLAPYVGASEYRHQGKRVVAGQRIMQAASDPFLGWTPGTKRCFYVRQLRDMKGPSDPVENLTVLSANAAIIGGTLARAHARSLDPSLILGYLGNGGRFHDAMVRFARSYAAQAERDHERLGLAVRNGEVPCERGV